MADEQLGQFKSQPWVVFDTVSAPSFLLGENRPELFAVGTNGPAITNSGQINFFDTGRTEPRFPWYTSLELVGQLSYGFKCWQAFLHFGFPQVPDRTSTDPNSTDVFPAPLAVSLPAYLAATIINFGVMQMDLGQEEQMSFPVSRFGAGGGFMATGAAGVSVIQNSIPNQTNVLKLPEPVEIARTQNINARIRIAPEVFPTIGTVLLPGVGVPLVPGSYTYNSKKGEVNLDWGNYTIQFGLIGERIKKTQYGQVPASLGA